jgi:hypothetical protein
MLCLLTALLIACDDPVVYKTIPLPAGVIGCDTVSYEDRSEKVIFACGRTDGQVTLIWTEFETVAAYGEWTVDPPWGHDIAEITDSDCSSPLKSDGFGICAITTKRFPVSDTPGAVYFGWVDNPPAPWQEVIGSDFTGWTAIASSGVHSGIEGHSEAWVLGAETGFDYGAALPHDLYQPDWLINRDPMASHPCSGPATGGIHHTRDRDDPRWLSVSSWCVERSDVLVPGNWRLGSYHNIGWMHTRNVVWDPGTTRWLAATDALYSSSDDGATWVSRPRSIFQGFTEPYFVWLVGDGTQLWAMGERPDVVWYSRNGGRSFVTYETWIPGHLVISGATVVRNSRYDATLMIMIATDHQKGLLHIAVLWDPGE